MLAIIALTRASATGCARDSDVSQHGFTLFEFIIAFTLSAILCAGLFHCMVVMQTLYRKQIAIAQLQEKIRFLTFFLREKIASAGDFSCEPDRKIQEADVIHSYSASDAENKLGLRIAPKTDVLQLYSCVHVENEVQYLPIDFFVANTARVARAGKPISALFMKIEQHPREELITGMTDLHVQLITAPTQDGVRAVKIDYVLSSADSVVSLYQSGALYAMRRNAFS